MSSLREDAMAVTFPGFDGRTAPSWVLDRLVEGMAGVFLFGRNISSGSTAALCSQLRDARPEALICIDEEGGDLTRLHAREGSPFPGNAALGQVDDPALTAEVAAQIARHLQINGINVNAAPVADVNTAAANPVIGVRSFGADPQLVARHTAAFIAGSQRTGVAATVKHFPGHGSTITDSHLELPVVNADEATLRTRDLLPFHAAIAADVALVMTAHLLVPAWDDPPATLSHRILTGLLREELGFQGVIMTDGLDMHAISRGVGRDQGAVLAIAAGADALCVGGESSTAEDFERVVAGIVTAVHDGRLPRQRLAEAAERVRALADRFIPRQQGQPAPDPGSPRTEVAHPVVSDVARPQSPATEAARRALTVVGDVTLSEPPLVVELRTEATIAIGEVAWGIGAELTSLLPGTEVLALHSGEALDLTGVTRPVVLCARDTAQHPWQRAAIEAARAQCPELIVVDCGWPSSAALLGPRHLVTWGASAIGASTAAQALVGLSAGPNR